MYEHYFCSVSQLPRYSSLKKLLSGVLQYFLTSDSSTSSTAHAPTPVTSSVATLRVAPTGVSEASPGPQEGVSSGNGAGAGPGSSPLEVRVKLLQQHLDQFPRNKDDREKLLSSGYRSSLWEQVRVFSHLCRRAMVKLTNNG